METLVFLMFSALALSGAGLVLFHPNVVHSAFGLAASLFAVAGLFLGAVYTAKISGHWRSRVPETELRLLLKEIDSPRIAHPPFRSN